MSVLYYHFCISEINADDIDIENEEDEEDRIGIWVFGIIFGFIFKAIQRYDGIL